LFGERAPNYYYYSKQRGTTNMSRNIVTIARSWIGTPYADQQGTKGVATDCIRFIKGVADELGYLIEIENYNNLPTGNQLIQELDKRLIRVDRELIEPGNILCFKTSFRGLPTHLGFASDIEGELGVIEADSRVGRVVESRLGFRCRLLVGAWSLGLD